MQKHSHPVLKRLLSISALLLIASSGWALTLPELQQTGIRNRKVIERYRLAVEQAEKRQDINRGAFWPSVDLQYSANALDEDSATENDRNSELVDSVSYNLFSGFRDHYLTGSTDQLKTAREYELKRVIQDVKLRITLRYIEVYTNQNHLTVAKDGSPCCTNAIKMPRIALKWG